MTEDGFADDVFLSHAGSVAKKRKAAAQEKAGTRLVFGSVQVATWAGGDPSLSQPGFGMATADGKQREVNFLNIFF